MSRRSSGIRDWTATCALAALGATVPALAAIVDNDATVSTRVQELIDGEPGSINSHSETLDRLSPNVPVVATAHLTSTDLEGKLVSLGQGFSQFTDPTRRDRPNPEEFALEVACYSKSESVSYLVTSSALESRTIVFTRRGNAAASPEINFGLSSTREVESRVFLSGAVLIWSTEPDINLDGLLTELRVTVTRDGRRTPLFETTLAVAGHGVGQVESTATGPIHFEVIELDELLDAGIDQQSAAVLQAVADEGTIAILVIPSQEHAYTYTVTASEELVLTANLETRIRNIPGGSGVAATLGRPFEELAGFIEQAIPGVDGAAFQRSLHRAIARRDLGLVSQNGTRQPRTAKGMCGAFGLEGAITLALGLFLSVGRLVRLQRIRPKAALRRT